MSRTDKDTPWWVITQEWKPDHYRCLEAVVPPRRWSQYRAVYEEWDRECDLPAEPRLKDYQSTGGRLSRANKQCRWVPVWPRGWRGLQSPPRLFIEQVWNAPSRRELRDGARNAIKEYRATGEVDIILPTAQHRHCAMWLYW